MMRPKFLTFLFLFLFGCIFDKEDDFIPPPLVIADIHGCWLLVDDPRFESCKKICLDSIGFFYSMAAMVSVVGGEVQPASEIYGKISFIEQHKNKTLGGGYIGKDLTIAGVCKENEKEYVKCNQNETQFSFEHMTTWVDDDLLYGGEKVIATRMSHIDEACFSHGYTTGGLIDFDVMFK